MFTEYDDAAALDYADFGYDDLDLDYPDPSEYAPDLPDRDEDNACPECPTGVVLAGPQEYDTGHIPHFCSECGWES